MPCLSWRLSAPLAPGVSKGPLPRVALRLASGTHQEEVVRHQIPELRAAPDARGQAPCGIAVPGHHIGVVDGDPVLDLASEVAEAEFGVIPEVVGQGTVGPAAIGVLQALGQVPVVQGDHGLHAQLPQPLQQAPVVAQPLAVWGARAAIGEHPRPRDGEAVVGDPELAQPLRVSEDVVVAVAGHVPGGRRGRRGGARRQAGQRGTAWGRRGVVGERVPDGRALAVLPPAALRLVSGAAHGPEEAVGEGAVEQARGLGGRGAREAGPGLRTVAGLGAQAAAAQGQQQQQRQRQRRRPRAAWRGAGGHAARSWALGRCAAPLYARAPPRRPPRAARPPPLPRRARLTIITCEPAPPPPCDGGRGRQGRAGAPGGGATAGEVRQARLPDVGEKAPVPRGSQERLRMFRRHKFSPRRLRFPFRAPSWRKRGAGARRGGKAADQLSPSWGGSLPALAESTVGSTCFLFPRTRRPRKALDWHCYSRLGIG